MATKLPYPPGKTRCDWCHKVLAWKDGQFAEHELLCPSCWPTWLKILAEYRDD